MQISEGLVKSTAELLNWTVPDADRSNMTVQSIFTSRAVTRLIEAGNTATCAACRLPVKFRAKSRLQQVIANVYDDGVWNRVEHYHVDCYDTAGRPYGPAN